MGNHHSVRARHGARFALALAGLAVNGGAAFAAAAYDNIPRAVPNPVLVGGCVVDDSRVQPAAALPQISNLASTYEIDLAAWGIPGNATNPAATTAGLNAAIAWAHAEGYGTVRVPAGTYLVGEELYPWYMGGVELPGNIHLELDPAATLQMTANDKAFYCIIDIPGESDVKVSGGTLRGDRLTHTYAGGGSHEFGYGICLGSTGGSERVLIEDMEIFDATGDGITVNDAPGVSRDITIRGNDIHHHRRQGISVVGGTDVVIEDNAIHDIGGTDFESGTPPQFGIDIEATLGDNDNRNFLIRGNNFADNQGGDFVNTGGRNVWLIGNTMSNAGLVERQGDAPIILWHKGDHIVRDNVVTSSISNGNGHWALVTYPLGTRPDALDIIENNTFYGGGINVGGGDHASVMAHVRIAGNTIHGHNFVAGKIPCLEFNDNEVLDDGSNWAFILRNLYGNAAGNRRNGVAVDIPLSPEEVFDELLHTRGSVK